MAVTTNIQRLRLHRAIISAFIDAKIQIVSGKAISAPYLSGAPGGGKTKSIEAQAKKEGYGFVSRNMGMARLEEFGGIPDMYRDSDGVLNTEWSVPELVVVLRKLSSENPAVVCLLDDWHLAAPAIQSLGYELFTDHAIKGHHIPKNVFFILAGNDTPAAGARAQYSAVMNRVAKKFVMTDFEYWKDYYAIPNNVHPAVVSFLETKEHRSLFHGDEDTMNPWPSPRSWTNYATKLSELESSGIPFDTDEQIAETSSYVGEIAAQKFNVYYKIYSKFDLDKIFGEGKFKIPEDPIDRFAFGAATSFGFFELYDKYKEKAGKTFVAILKELQAKYPEIAVRSVRYILFRDQKLFKLLIDKGIINTDLMTRLNKTTDILGGK